MFIFLHLYWLLLFTVQSCSKQVYTSNYLFITLLSKQPLFIHHNDTAPKLPQQYLFLFPHWPSINQLVLSHAKFGSKASSMCYATRIINPKKMLWNCIWKSFKLSQINLFWVLSFLVSNQFLAHTWSNHLSSSGQFLLLPSSVFIFIIIILKNLKLVIY